MKNTILVVLLVFWGLLEARAQRGLFAGSQKKMMGRKHTCGKTDGLFKGWKYTGGFVLTSNDGTGVDQTIITYQKATTILVLFITNIEKSPDCTIEDILEITNVSANTNLQTATCTVNGESKADIIALEKNGRILKAWRADKDRNRFDTTDTKGIDCLVEGL